MGKDKSTTVSKKSDKTSDKKSDKSDDKHTESKKVKMVTSTKDAKDTKDTTKDTKNSKKGDKSEKSEVKESKTYPNAETEKAGTVFDVNKTKKWLKSYFHKDEYKVTWRKPSKKSEEKDGDNNGDGDGEGNGNGNTEDRGISFTHSNHALTVVDQVLCSSVINLAVTRAKKNSANLYEVTDELLMDSVKLNAEYGNVLGKYLDS